MKTALLSFVVLAAAVAYLTRRESMHKQKPAASDRMSHRWRVETAYSKEGDAA
jgi:hypothetical protein